MPKLGRQASLSFSHSAHMCREKWICWSCHFPLFLMFAQVGDLAKLGFYVSSVHKCLSLENHVFLIDTLSGRHT
jgi:hypothetical protein